MPLWGPARTDYWMLRLTAATSTFASGTSLAIAWTQEDADPQALHAASATTVVVAAAGIYLVGFQVFTGSAAMTVELQKNGAASALDPGDTNTANGMYSATGLVSCAAADTLRVFVTNNSGAPQAAGGGTTNYQASKFWGQYLHPA